MAVLKCKMCGGDIVADTEQSYGTCGSCGSTSTIPKVNDEQIANLFNRANHFRMQNDFDKALLAYENILNTDNANAEAHWGVVLSRYGIEYIDDPITRDKVPTCHRVQVQSILEDRDYLSALEYAGDGYTASLYEEEAKQLYEMQKRILEISRKEEPYDVFICYKETSPTGTRTVDSTLAQDIYYQFMQEGYKVFFAKITLEDKLGTEYEPYIFSALNSAKIMLVIGTTTEYFNATWVKNEWIRYLELMKTDKNRLLIPCYRDMDAYDIPMELSMLQSQDMSKIGFMQDLIRGINKVLAPVEPTAIQPTVTQTVVTQSVESPANVSALLKRADIFLGDGDFSNAGIYYERILDIDPECAMAYWGKYKTEMEVTTNNGILDKLKGLFDNLYKEEIGDSVTVDVYMSQEQTEALNLLREQDNSQDLYRGINAFNPTVVSDVSRIDNTIESFRVHTPQLNSNVKKAIQFAKKEEGAVFNQPIVQLEKYIEERRQEAVVTFRSIEERLPKEYLAYIDKQLAMILNRIEKRISDKRIAINKRKKRIQGIKKRIKSLKKFVILLFPLYICSFFILKGSAFMLVTMGEYETAQKIYKTMCGYEHGDSNVINIYPFYSYQSYKDDSDSANYRKVNAEIKNMLIEADSASDFHSVGIAFSEKRVNEDANEYSEYRELYDEYLEKKYRKMMLLLANQEYEEASYWFGNSYWYEDDLYKQYKEAIGERNLAEMKSERVARHIRDLNWKSAIDLLDTYSEYPHENDAVQRQICLDAIDVLVATDNEE
ncbi:MAG: toll/interleukin-1 receptor domain-containing protein [Eubacteriales bacterium]